MGFKLADGSDSDLYRVGDTFVATGDVISSLRGEVVSIFELSGGKFISCKLIAESGPRYSPYLFAWEDLSPTEETKRKVAERNQPKCKCGYVIPVMEIGPARSVDFGEHWEASADTLDSAHRYLFGIDCEKSIDNPEPLARIIDWRGGEEVKPLDFVVSNEFGVDYRAVVLEVVSPTQIRTCRGLIGASHGNLTIIRINTAAIPKRRTMTKAEVEREFGIKISD